MVIISINKKLSNKSIDKIVSKSNNTILHNMSNAVKAVVENSIQIVFLNIKIYVKKSSKKKEKNLIHKNKESYLMIKRN